MTEPQSEAGALRRVGSRPSPAPVPQPTPQEHLDTVQRILEGFSRSRQVHPQYVLAALDHLGAAREKLGMKPGSQVAAAASGTVG